MKKYIQKERKGKMYCNYTVTSILKEDTLDIILEVTSQFSNIIYSETIENSKLKGELKNFIGNVQILHENIID